MCSTEQELHRSEAFADQEEKEEADMAMEHKDDAFGDYENGGKSQIPCSDQGHRQLEQIDQEILRLYDKRLEVVKKLFEKQEGSGGALRGAQAKRMEEVLSAYRESSPVSGDVRIACQGVEGSFSTSGANEMFPGKQVVYCKEFGDVFDAVSSGKAGIGVLPVENSFSGSVLPVYDLMKEHSFYIYRCQKVRVRHCLLGLPGTRLEEMERVYSHEQGLAQCSRFLREHELTGIKHSNTAAAAKFVSHQGERSSGAVASKACGQLYGLEVLAEGIQNREENYTRFIAITREFHLPANANKVSVCLSAPHREGSLYHVLGRFAANGLNLTKIESRPIENVNFAFMFFLEFEGNIRTESVKRLLCQLAEELDSFSFLGNYREE